MRLHRPTSSPRILAAAAILACSQVLASGMSTHFHAADLTPEFLDARAYPALYLLLRGHGADEFRVGAIFPDWGYPFEDTHDAAEAAHWPPFYNHLVDFIKRKYVHLDTRYAQRLFAFAAGIVCHDGMDEVWHFGDTAFLNVAIDMDIPGNPNGHTIIEVMTDIFVQVDERPGTEEYRWFVPLKDMTEVYHELGWSVVTEDRILDGYKLMYLGTLLEDLGGGLIYWPGRAWLPWTQANYMAWWDGGVLDGSRETAQRLHAYWDLWQQLGADPAIAETANDASVDFSGLPRLDGPRHCATANEGLVALARELLAKGALDVAVRPVENGAVELVAPVVRDPAAVRAALREYAARLVPAHE